MMNDLSGLDQLFARSAERFPQRVAVIEADGGSIDYRDLAELAGRTALWLAGSGVGRGDRVGIYLHKSIESVAAILGTLESGAAYVPVDPLAPVSRAAFILSDCAVKAVVVERTFVELFHQELTAHGAAPKLLVVDELDAGNGLCRALDDAALRSETAKWAAPTQSELAYVLYTSGSTGRPKGVMLSHENALCFVNWCSDIFAPSEEDRFSSHAPFHFDLSILDLYVPLRHGAAVVLIGEGLGKEPARLAQAISEQGISVWYSAPSILTMLASQGRLDQYDWRRLRMVLFAGEVFPVKHLRTLKALWKGPRYFNLYGPTETNVCTWFEVPAEIEAERTEPFPIGKVCAHYRDRIADSDGRALAADAEGELCIAGPGVMQGYWNQPQLDERVFLNDPDGTRWYRTGDIVQRDQAGDFRFLGRRDRMIKKRGYRVELGEIEAALYRHPEVKEAAVVAVAADDGPRVTAFLSTKSGDRLSIIALKQFCIEQLPQYMTPDAFQFIATLPKTSTDKVDYQRLKEQL